jgi:membrane protein DedA with SNARE-associated domain
VFKNDTEAERQHWLRTKARGKSRFIWREILGTVLICLIVVVAVEFFGDHTRPSSVRSGLLVSLMILPIAVLGGYLSGNWKWKDFEKKYPE